VITESRYIIDETHTDELGHLNHVSAIKLLEVARDEWYHQAGLWEGRPWSDKEVLGTIVVNVNVNYRLECFLNEEVVVRSFPVSKGTKSFTIGHEIIKPDGLTAIDGQATSVVMNLESHEVLIVPDSMGRYLPAK
jgi:thioesterase-3